jgi:hypothetical protein
VLRPDTLQVALEQICRLRIGRKINGCLYQFPGKLALHPGVGIAQLKISKFLWNPPSSCTVPTAPLLHAGRPLSLSVLHFRRELPDPTGMLAG